MLSSSYNSSTGFVTQMKFSSWSLQVARSCVEDVLVLPSLEDNALFFARSLLLQIGDLVLGELQTLSHLVLESLSLFVLIALEDSWHWVQWRQTGQDPTLDVKAALNFSTAPSFIFIKVPRRCSSRSINRIDPSTSCFLNVYKTIKMKNYFNLILYKITYIR